MEILLRGATWSVDVRPTRGAVRPEETPSASSPPRSIPLYTVRESWRARSLLRLERSRSRLPSSSFCKSMHENSFRSQVVMKEEAPVLAVLTGDLLKSGFAQNSTPKVLAEQPF